jgi:hypothetical protein
MNGFRRFVNLLNGKLAAPVLCILNQMVQYTRLRCVVRRALGGAVTLREGDDLSANSGCLGKNCASWFALNRQRPDSPAKLSTRRSRASKRRRVGLTNRLPSYARCGRALLLTATPRQSAPVLSKNVNSPNIKDLARQPTDWAQNIARL